MRGNHDWLITRLRLNRGQCHSFGSEQKPLQLDIAMSIRLLQNLIGALELLLCRDDIDRAVHGD